MKSHKTPLVLLVCLRINKQYYATFTFARYPNVTLGLSFIHSFIRLLYPLVPEFRSSGVCWGPSQQTTAKAGCHPG